MKKTLSLLLLLIVTATAYSQSNVVCQVIDWSSKTAKFDSSEKLAYETEEIKVTYNFWSDIKFVSFTIYNKTDKPVIIDWAKSHIILQDYSNDYFGSSSTFSRNSNGVGSSLTHLPPKSYIEENFTNNTELYFSCTSYFKKMKKGDVVTNDYKEDNSIYKMRNYITYLTSDNKEKVVDNDFYVSQLLRMSKETFLGVKNKNEICDALGKKKITYDYSYPYFKINRSYQYKILPSSGCCM
ncbi:MAG: hypothetical protein V4667_07885 [Bacteroidota bacterium]